MMTTDDYSARLKEALTGRADAEFVWLCNFEVEQEWRRGRPTLPTGGLSATPGLVRGMEELGALLAAPNDHILLGAGLNAGYRRYLERGGLRPPHELCVSGATDEAATGPAATVQGDPELSRRLKELGTRGAYLMAMGTSPEVESLAEATGLRLATPQADVARTVNSKAYSRRIVEELGLPGIPGQCCETVEQLRAALNPLPGPDAPLIVKESYGVSGKGALVLDHPKKAEGLLRLLERRSWTTGDHAVDVVVESYLPKRRELAYQVTIGRSGQVTLDFVRGSLTTNGVHRGNLTPAELNRAQRRHLTQAADLVGARLFADGYFGVAGIDALVTSDDTLYPVLEINARLTMPTYQARPLARFGGSDGVMLATYYPLQLAAPLAFEGLQAALGDLIGPPVDGSGVLVTCFGTVNAQATTSTTFPGRLYAMLFGPNVGRLRQLDAHVADALGQVSEGAVNARL